MTSTLRYPRPSALAKLGLRHNVVESSAGTGKTFLLEHLFVDLIVTRAIPIDQILVVTYTEKATAELVLRLRKLVSDLVNLDAEHPKAKQAAGAGPDDSWLIDAAAKERLGQALLSFDRASISTIHGFCQRILRDHSFVQGRLGWQFLATAGGFGLILDSTLSLARSPMALLLSQRPLVWLGARTRAH